MAADAAGNVYVTGGTYGDLVDDAIANDREDLDAFLNKYDADGTLAWSRQFRSEGREQGDAVTIGADGGVYVSGLSPDGKAFLRGHDSDGTELWTQLLGSRSNGTGISLDGLGSLYMSGNTWGDLAAPNAGNRDAFVARYMLPSLLAADFDNDGDVDGDDFLLWQAGYAIDAGGDADGDGDTDGDDFLLWQAEYGTAGSGSRQPIGVPEPTAAWLMLAAGMAAVSKPGFFR